MCIWGRRNAASVRALTAGSISFTRPTLTGGATKKGKKNWITLFDDPSDDEYDGDFTENDPEMPMILFGFKKSALEKGTKTAAPERAPPLERNEDWSVDALKEYLGGRLKQMIESIQTD